MTARIPLGGEVFALVDVADAAALAALPWHALRAPDGSARYARTNIKNGDGRFRSVLMHRHLLAAPADMHVDHINGNGLDNRRANLRLATPSQNASNKRPTGSSGLSGVRRYGRKFLALIAPNGMEIALGMYDTAAEAGAVYNAAALVVYGEFARLNPGAPAVDALDKVLAQKQRSAERLLAEITVLKKGVAL